MRLLASLLLLALSATSLCAESKRKFSPPRYKYHKPGKYKAPKISAEKWKPTKEQRKLAAKDLFGRPRQ